MSEHSTVRSAEVDSIEVVCPEPVDTYAMSSIQSSITPTGNDRDTTVLKPHKKSPTHSLRQHSGPLQHSTNYLTANEMPLPKSRSHSDVTTMVLQQSPPTIGRARVKQVALDGPSDTSPDLPRPVHLSNEQGRSQYARTDHGIFHTKMTHIQPSSQNDASTDHLHLPDSHFRPISPQAKVQPCPANSLTDNPGHSAYPLNHQFNLTSGNARPQYRYSTPQPYTTPQLYTTPPYTTPQPHAAPQPYTTQPHSLPQSYPLATQSHHVPPRPASSQLPPMSNNFFEILNGSPPTLHPSQRTQVSQNAPQSNTSNPKSNNFFSPIPMSTSGTGSHTVFGRNSGSLQSNNFFETVNSVHVQSVPFQPNVTASSDIPPYLQSRPRPDNPVVSLASIPVPDRYNTLPTATPMHPNTMPNPNPSIMQSNNVVMHPNAMPNPGVMQSNGGVMRPNTVPNTSIMHPDAGVMHPSGAPNAIPRHMMLEHVERRASSLPPTTEEHPLDETHPPQPKKTSSLPVDKSKSHIPNNFF